MGKLVVVSTPIKRSAFYPEFLAQQGQVTAAAAEAMKHTPMYQLYASLALRPEDRPLYRRRNAKVPGPFQITSGDVCSYAVFCSCSGFLSILRIV